MNKLWAVTIGALLFLGWIASGMMDVHGSIPANVKEISRHEMFMATQAASAEATALEFKLQQRVGLLGYIIEQNRGHSFHEFIIKELEKEIEDLRAQLKNLRGY